jgi:hypothetical protein
MELGRANDVFMADSKTEKNWATSFEDMDINVHYEGMYDRRGAVRHCKVHALWKSI